MWNKVELNPKEGLFLMKNGLYIYPDKNITSEVKDKVIGYVLDESRIMSINSSKNYISWSLRHNDIPGLINYKYDNRSIEPYKDIDGKYNTNCIVDYCKENNINLQNDYPATYYCTSYSPGFHDGKWYFPSAGELKLFYDNREKFRESCKLIGLETNMNSDYSGHRYFWSSTEHSSDDAWFLLFSLSSPSLYVHKDCDYYVVPFLKPTISL